MRNVSNAGDYFTQEQLYELSDEAISAVCVGINAYEKAMGFEPGNPIASRLLENLLTHEKVLFFRYYPERKMIDDYVAVAKSLAVDRVKSHSILSNEERIRMLEKWNSQMQAISRVEEYRSWFLAQHDEFVSALLFASGFTNEVTPELYEEIYEIRH